jgi:hypothetical protein
MVSFSYDITNAVVFAAAMIRHPELALQVVRRLHPDRNPQSVKVLVDKDTDEPIVLTELSTKEEIEVAWAEVEKTILVSAATRGARLDLYFEDDKVVIAIEMQRETEKFVVGRSIFISGILTSYLLKRGATFDEMKQIRVTFIYLHDPFGFGDCHNPMEYKLLKHPEYVVGDSPRIDFYYASGDASDVTPDIQEMMEYFRNPNAYDMSKAHSDLIPALQLAAEEVMKDERVQRMVAMAIAHDKSIYQEGIDIGRREAAIDAIHEGVSDSGIARIGKMTIDEARALRREVQS